MNNFAHQRLYNQQISQSQFGKPEEVVRHMTAMQAQDFYAALWAVGLRASTNITEAEVEQALADRTIVRTWPMRGTLHFIAAEDVRWMLKLLTPRVIKSSAGRHRDLELNEATFSKSRKLLEKAMQGGNQLTRPEVYSVLEDGGISTEGQRGYHIIGYLAQKAMLCWGTQLGRQHRFTLLDEWIPESKKLEGDEALAELASRYIKSRGPATEYDFSNWSGLTVTSSRKALRMVEDNFEKEITGEHTWWFPEPSHFIQKNSSETYLLPGFDEMICGYKDRSAILPTDQEQSIILRNGILKPLIISNGKGVGSWKRTLKTTAVDIELQPFGELTRKQEKEARVKAAEYAAFLGLQPRVEVA